jgi:hypothetical protein
MKKIIFIKILICISLLINGQSIYYDALSLKKYLYNGKFIVPKNKNDSIGIKKLLEYETILKKYIPEIKDINNPLDILTYLNASFENPFISNLIPSPPSSSDDELSKALKSSSFSYVPKIGSLSIPGLNVTTLADGLAKFIVKRTKEELSIAFFDKFKEEIKKYPDLKTLFPQTYVLLDAIDQQIYNYTNYISILREAFLADIKELDEHLPGIIVNHPVFFDNRFELALSLKSACYISTSLKHGMHPGDILDAYPIDYFKDTNDVLHDTVLRGAIQTLQLLSESFREVDTSKHTYWVSIDKIRELVNDKNTFKIYLGLIFQNAKNNYDSIRFNKTETLVDMLNKLGNNFDHNYLSYKRYILVLGNRINELNTMIKEHVRLTSDSIMVEQYAKYFKATLQLLQYCTQMSELPYLNQIPELKNFEVKSKSYFNVAFSTIDVVVSINRKRYAEAVNHVLAIYTEIFKKPFSNEVFPNSKDTIGNKKEKEILKKIYEAYNNAPNTPVSSILDEQTKKKLNETKKIENREKTDSIIFLISQYGSFMASIVQAKSSDEVEAAIEAVALPTGSSRIKRESSFNVSLNAYCGFYAGHEEIKFSLKESPLINSYGLTAPIGFSINWGSNRFLWMPCKRPGHFSHSIFISTFDIGAISSFRFVDDTTKTLSKIELKDIISPGIFYSLGIAKTPLSINIGYQISPFLREVSSSSNTFKASYSRFSISLCVDIPILNLYTKPR